MQVLANPWAAWYPRTSLEGNTLFSIAIFLLVWYFCGIKGFTGKHSIFANLREAIPSLPSNPTLIEKTKRRWVARFSRGKDVASQSLHLHWSLLFCSLIVYHLPCGHSPASSEMMSFVLIQNVLLTSMPTSVSRWKLGDLEVNGLWSSVSSNRHPVAHTVEFTVTGQPTFALGRPYVPVGHVNAAVDNWRKCECMLDRYYLIELWSLTVFSTKASIVVTS